MMSDQTAGKKILIFSHYATTGACEELRDWLVAERAREVVYVAFPFGSDRGRPIRVDCFREGRHAGAHRSRFRSKLPEPFAYAKDFLYALGYALRFGRKADVLVAGDNLLAAAGILTRRLTGVGHVVYYMIDYTPVRYTNRLLNTVYYAIDRFAATRADAVWPLTEQIIRGRFDAGRLDERRVRWYAVPYGSHPLPAPLPEACDRRRVVYLGDVIRNKGAELFVPMARELKKMIPDFRFTVVGGGRDVQALREEVRAAGLEEQVEVCGFVEDIGEALGRLAGAGVAIAPYYPFDANSFTFYSDPGKIKVYLGCGLPVVLTDVPPIAKVLEREGAGRIAKYDAADFAKTVAAVLNDDGYLRIRENARTLGERCAWPKVFEAAFARLDV
jgi:glycosyltransferase involved in cell wall biosynthesis